MLTGNGPSPRDGGWAFCSGGDQRIRGADGYQYEDADGDADPARLGRLHILEVQRLIRFMPKVVIAVVPGWAGTTTSGSTPAARQVARRSRRIAARFNNGSGRRGALSIASLYQRSASS